MTRIRPWRSLSLAFIAILCALACYLFIPTDPATRKVAAVFTIAVFFWAFEITPLYATSLLVVVLLTLLMDQNLQYFWIPFSSPVIILFLGGLTLAAAAKRHGVDHFLIEKVLAKVGFTTTTLLISSAFFSMWISNTAAAALMLMLVMPAFHNLETDDPIKRRVILAIAFGANIGGIMTPIGTPPNAIALGILRDFGIEIDFLRWMLYTVPFALILLAVTAVVLTLLFPSKTKLAPPKVFPKLTKKGKGVLVIACLMIALWLTKVWHHIPESLVALIGLTLFALFRLIKKEEIRSIQWDILILMWGGLALGEAVLSSDVFHEIVKIPLFQEKGVVLLITFGILAVLLTSFISNTATANLLLPIAIAIDPTNKLLIAITIALACSFSFAFPISTPPNALAYGTGHVSVKEMFKAGGLLSALSLALLLVVASFV
ncbi:MAG: DASS family sodium-coupled anion symporter [Chlamydiales bacterium]|nr:DASS family sodium-coupled anion symporter [Chlamydiales bacterium]